MKYQKNGGFTLIELIVVITILSILGSVSYLKFGSNGVEDYLTEYKSQVINRIDDLYKKSLIGINWHYNNSGVLDVDYIKLYCDEINKTFFAYVCDKTNPTSPSFNNCKQIDFPTLQNLKYGTFLSTYTKSNVKINHCMFLDKNTSLYNNGSFYITVYTSFPNGKIETYKENTLNTQDNEKDDTIVDNVKINVKEGIVVKEFFPLYFK